MGFINDRKIDGDIAREKKRRFNKGPKKGMNKFNIKKNKKENGNKRFRIKIKNGYVDENGVKYIV